MNLKMIAIAGAMALASIAGMSFSAAAANYDPGVDSCSMSINDSIILAGANADATKIHDSVICAAVVDGDETNDLFPAGLAMLNRLDDGSGDESGGDVNDMNPGRLRLAVSDYKILLDGEGDGDGGGESTFIA